MSQGHGVDEPAAATKSPPVQSDQPPRPSRRRQRDTNCPARMREEDSIASLVLEIACHAALHDSSMLSVHRRPEALRLAFVPASATAATAVLPQALVAVVASAACSASTAGTGLTDSLRGNRRVRQRTKRPRQHAQQAWVWPWRRRLSRMDSVNVTATVPQRITAFAKCALVEHPARMLGPHGTPTADAAEAGLSIDALASRRQRWFGRPGTGRSTGPLNPRNHLWQLISDVWTNAM